MCSSNYVKNPHLPGVAVDELFHLGLNTNDDLKGTFGDVKFVCLGGSSTRMLKFAELIQKELNKHNGLYNGPVASLTKTDRYVMYKCGPVLSVNHGIGIPSISIILNELIKLLHYAGAKDVIFFRMGTCGGLGTEPGTVVITKKVVNELLKPIFEQIVLGKKMSYPSDLDSKIASELMICGKFSNIPVVSGDTMCTSDFYEGQARLDGAFCDYKEEDKLSYLQKVHKAGVCNIEMESACFAAMCKRAEIAAGVVCVTLVNRLKGDQVSLDQKEHEDFQTRPMKIIISYIIKQLLNNIQT